MSFLKKNYEKIILLGFLCFFIISLVWLISSLTKSLQINEADLHLPPMDADYDSLDSQNFLLSKTLSAETRWRSSEPRSETALASSNLFIPYRAARCTSCSRIIPVKSFKLGVCPLCNAPIEEFIVDTPKGTEDMDGDGIKDKYELAHGMNPDDPNDAYTDIDNDGFDNMTEYMSKPQTSANDPKSHPPLVHRLAFLGIKRNKLPLVLKNITIHGTDPAKWDIQIEIPVKRKMKTLFLKQGAEINLNGVEYTISKVIQKIDKVYSRQFKTEIKVDNSYIIIESEDGDIIKAMKKQPVWENEEHIYLADLHLEKRYTIILNDFIIAGNAHTGTEKYTCVKVNRSDDGSPLSVIMKNQAGIEYTVEYMTREEIEAKLNLRGPETRRDDSFEGEFRGIDIEKEMRER